MFTYQFTIGGRRVFVDADGIEEACAAFTEKTGLTYDSSRMLLDRLED